VQLQTVDDDQLYRNLDHLHPHRQKIEAGLAEREKRLYNLDDTIYLYDLTSTYFEGKCLRNPKAQRGDSRDHRPDCKQVVVGLVINQDGFPKAHEIFSGNRVDSTTVEEMLQALEQRVGPRPDNSKVLVVVDRGMASTHNLEEIQRHGYDYLVAAHQKERDEWLAEFETNATWREVLRENSPNNPCQKKTRMRVHQVQRGAETLVLCLSDDRVAKDRAIRESKEAQLREDVQALARRIAAGRLKQEAKLHQAIGRLRERYPRVARYYHLDYDQERQQVICEEKTELKREAEQLDGAYLLKTNRQGLEAEQIWRLYSLLTRVENAFRAIKSPLEERPIFHHLEYRVETHIFLCLLAYHLLVAIETTLRRQGVYTSWESVCQTLSTHHVATMVLPTSRGDVLHIRKGSTPEPEVCELYHQLGVPKQLMKPVKTMFLGTHR
jgi:transposase